MAGKSEPASLIIGTAVSAKYKGAFCEAKVKKVNKQVKVKVNLLDGPGSLDVLDDVITGPIKIGATVDVKPNDNAEPVRGTISKVLDQSMYTVVFDDGDENTLRRSQLCLMGEKHFVKSETLDDLPLSHPEHFSTPVVRAGKHHGSDSESDSESSESESDSLPEVRGTRGSRRSKRRRSYSGRLAELLGRVVCMEMEDRKRTGMWVPSLVVLPCVDETSELKSREHLLVKSFKDSKYYTVHRKDVRDFTRKTAMDNTDKVLKGAYDKALLYFDTKELPQNWDKEELLGSDSEEAESESSDDEQCEERDRFVAQLYKFMDESGTPINTCPQIGTRDLDLYRLFRIVQNLGGYNKVTNQVKWPIAHRKMRLPLSSYAINQLKSSYNKYLYAFENFYRKLGSGMGSITRPSRRQTPGRNLISFRERESPRSKKLDEDETKSVTDESEKSESKVETPVPKAAKTPKQEIDKKEKKEEKKVDSDTESEGARKTRTRGEKKKEDEKPEKTEKPEKSKPKEKRPVRVFKESEDEKKRRPAKEEDKEDDKEKDKEKEKKPVRKKKEDKEKEKEREKEKEKEKEAADDSEEPSEDEVTIKKSRSLRDREEPFEIGTKMKVKYGRGKNLKIYEAKVMEIEEQGGTPTYFVHYAGWNNRYNEWIKKDRVVAILDEPKRSEVKVVPKFSPAVKANKLAAAVKAKAIMQIKKRGRPLGSGKLDQQPESKPEETVPSKRSSPSPQPADESSADSPAAPLSVPEPSSSLPPRPTRSTSIEASLSSGLPQVRRVRKSSGVGDNSPDVSVKEEEPESESSKSSSDESEDEAEQKRTTRSAAAQMLKTEERTPELKIEIMKVKDVTQSLRDANRAREVSSRMKEVAKFREVASKLKEVASKVKEVNTKVKEVTSKIKEEVTKEEQSLRLEEIRKEQVEKKKEQEEKDREKEKKSSDESLVEISVAKESIKVPSKTPKKKVEVKQESTDIETDSTKTSEETTSPEKPAPKKRGPKPKPQPQEPETRKRGPKPKRKVEEKAESQPEPQGETEQRPKKKRRKAEEKPEKEVKVEEEVKVKEEKEDKEETKVKEDFVRPPAPQLASLSLQRPSIDREELQLPQLSPQVPGNLEERRISLPGPPVIPVALPEPPPPPPAQPQPPKVDNPPPIPIPEEPTASCSRVLMDNTPPDTPENSPPRIPEPVPEPSVSVSQSPNRDEVLSTQSEKEANLEVEKLMDQPEGLESPNACDTSTISNGSGGSSGNVPESESDDVGPVKRKIEEEVPEKPAPKRRRRGAFKRNEASKKSSKAHVSDSDENPESLPSKPQSDLTSPPSAKMESHMSPANSQSEAMQHRPRVSKYNFLDFGDAKYLEGEDRINYLMDKINDLRKIYMSLKSEVACIDRRRKRHRRKEREAAQQAAIAAAQAAVDLVASQQHVELNQNSQS